MGATVTTEVVNLTLTALQNNAIVVSNNGFLSTAISLTNGQLLIGSTGADPVGNTIAATPNQTTVANGAGTITIGTAQNISATSSPTFASLSLNNGLNWFNGLVQEFYGTAVTTNATVTPFYTLNTQEDYVYQAEFLVYCYCTAGTKINELYDQKVYYQIKNVSNSVTATSFLNVVASGIAATQTVTTPGATAVFNIKGVASQTISWRMYLQIWSL
jgi:hypothetical protein